MGLEETFYRVSEGVGFMEVCAVVYSPNGNLQCPIDYAFDVHFSTSDGSAAGKVFGGCFSYIDDVCFLQCLTWTMVLSTLLYYLLHVRYGVV